MSKIDFEKVTREAKEDRSLSCDLITFCSEHNIEYNEKTKVFRFKIGNQEYRVAKHTIETSSGFEEMFLNKRHIKPVIHIKGSKKNIVEIYNRIVEGSKNGQV